MRRSIKVRLAVSFIGIMLLSLLSITAVNRLFLEKYYISRKADSLETVYKALNEQAYNDPEGRTHLQGLCIEKNISLDEMSLEEYQAISPVFEEDIYEAISMKNCVEKRNTIGAPGTEAMKEVITIQEKYLLEN